MTDSVAALEIFRSNPDAFDLIITDMAMPHMAGDQLTAALIKIHPTIPALLCTGHSERIDERRAKQKLSHVDGQTFARHTECLLNS